MFCVLLSFLVKINVQFLLLFLLVDGFIYIFIYSYRSCWWYFYFICIYSYYLHIYALPGIQMVKSLANPMSLIHPLLILGCFFLIKSFLLTMLYRYYIAIALSFILGGYWAFQEYNWGGWWNWDLIEAPLFVYCLVVVVFLHIFIVNNRFSSKKVLFLWNAHYFFIIILILNKFVITTSIHSFQQTKYRKIYFIYYYTVHIIRLFKFWVNFFSLKTLGFIYYILLQILYYCIVYFFKKSVFFKKIIPFKKKKLHKFIMVVIMILYFYNCKYVGHSIRYKNSNCYYSYTANYSRIFLYKIYFYKYFLLAKFNSIKFILFFHKKYFIFSHKNLIY